MYMYSEYFYNGDYTFRLFHLPDLPNLLFHPVNHYDVAYDKCVRGN